MNGMLERVERYRKAVAALAVPPLVVLAGAAVRGKITVADMIVAAIAALGGSGAVAYVRNEPEPERD